MHLIAQDFKTPRNKNYVNDIANVMKYSEWILKSLGLWPEVLKGAARFLPKIIFGFGNLVMFATMIPCFLYMLFEETDAIAVLKLCGLLGFTVISLVKYWALVVRKPKIGECIEQVKIDWMQVEFQKDREMMLKSGKMGRNLTILCSVFMYSAGMFYYTVMQYAKGTFVDEQNRTIKPLVYPTYSTLFNVQETSIYVLVYIVHCMCGYITWSVTAGAGALAALFAAHACGHIDIVVSRLDELTNGNVVKGNCNEDARLVEIIEHHLRILRFSANAEDVLQEICFAELLGSTITICLVEYYCIIDWEDNNTISLTTYMIVLISFTFNIFIFCYIGDILIEKTGSVGISCYMIDWYRLPTKTLRGLMLMVAMSNYPSKLSAGKIVDLSLASFGSVLKTSLAYLSFLRTAM